MNIQPIGDHIVLKAPKKETTTASGIIIPDTANEERPERGEVIAVGPGKMLENGQRQAMDVSLGDTVLFKKYAPDEIEVDGETLLIIKSDDVMAILK